MSETMSRSDLSHGASSRLSDLSDRAVDRLQELPEAELPETELDLEGLALDLVRTDGTMRELAQTESRIDSVANRRRKQTVEEGARPHDDPVFGSLREARSEVRDSIDQRLSELLDEAIEYARSVEKETEGSR
jgi:hypothetical protein